MLKRISDEAILCLLNSRKVRDEIDAIVERRIFVQAQLEADQKEHDAIKREIFERIEGHTSKELFSAGLFQAVMPNEEWQALKESAE